MKTTKELVDKRDNEAKFAVEAEEAAEESSKELDRAAHEAKENGQGKMAVPWHAS